MTLPNSFHFSSNTLIAHRGASIDAPENTCVAYDRAADVGFQWIEVDVQLTRDLVPVMMHDDTVDRTTNGSGFVCDFEFEEITALNAATYHQQRTPERIPSLEETIALCVRRNIGLILEIKPIAGQDIEHGIIVADCINRLWPQDRKDLMVSSFSASCLLALAKEAPWVSRVLASVVVPSTPQKYVDMLGVGGFHLNFDFARKQGIEELLALGAHVSVATVNDTQVIEQMFALGAHGVMTDRSDLIAHSGVGE